MANQATLTSPDKKYKTVVDVGSAQAPQLQSKGWGLGDTGISVLPVDQAITQSGNLVPTPAPAAPTGVPTTQPSGVPTQTQVQPPVQPQTAPQTQPGSVQQTQPQQATLQSPDGMSKVVVNVGSSEASQLQTQGWTLGAPGNAAVVTTQQALTPPANAQPTNTQQDIGQQDVPDDSFDFGSMDSGDLSTDPVTSELLAKYGVTPPSASGNPIQDYASTYNQVLNSMGLPDIKNEFNKVQERYTTLQNELNDKIADVNDDPWLSEGVRVGQIKKLQERYEGKLQILTDQQKLYDSMYQQGVQQAQYVASAAFQQQQFNSQIAFNVAELALKEQEARASLRSSNLRDQLAIAQEMRQQLADRDLSIEKRIDNSRQSLKLIADTFGADVFKTMSVTEKRKWEEDANLPPGTLDNAVSVAGDIGKIVDINGTDYVQNADGTFSQPSIPDAIPSSDKVEKADSVIAQIDALLNNPNLSKAIGPISSQIPQFLRSGAHNDVDAAIQQLIAGIAIENLSLLKGPMSDKDVQFIKQASSGLNTNMSEQGFKERLNLLKSKFEEIKNKAVSYSGGISDEELKQLRQLNPGMTDDEIRKQLGFNSGMGGTPTAQAKQIANAIKLVESGGNYQARGGSGESGAYQFMPFTWKSWAGKFLGNSNAPMTKENQDRVAIAKINELLSQGYDAKQVALIWNGGKPVVKKGVNKYGVAYDSGSYANKVLNALRNSG